MALLLAPWARAQVDTGIILGDISDTSGARVPGAEVVITNTDTNVSYTTISDATGHYRSRPLQVGHYAVSASTDGFKTATQTGISLRIRQEAVVDLTLEIGTIAEEVTVTADVQLLQTTEASRGEVIDNQKIVDLPLNGRNYLQLGLLTAGTNTPPPGARFGGFSASGMRVSHNNYLLDGMDNNSNQHAGQSRTGEVIRPSIDAIQEFKVQTSNFSAEFGRNVGAVVNASIKSGSNQFHGGLFEFIRNEKLDAKNFFDDPDAPVPPLKRNQFGGLLGGPIVRNRTFFFADYQGTIERRSGTAQSTIPTVAEADGDFSNAIFNNQPVRLFDPDTYDPATDTRDAFPNNIIPQSRIDEVGRKVADLYPAPNRPGFINNFFSNPLTREDTHQFDVRVDHTISAKDTVYGRYSQQRYEELEPQRLPGRAFTGGVRHINEGYSGVFTHTHIFAPNLIHTLKAGYNRLWTTRTLPIDGDINQDLGLAGTAPIDGMASFTFSGFQNVGFANTPQLADSQTRQLTSDLAWTAGRHTVKAGANLNWLQTPHTQAFQSKGVFTFDGGFSRQTSNNQFGNPFADLLIGYPTRTQISTTAYGNQRRRLYAFYMQDDWRVNDRLTFNIGLRWEYVGPWFEKYNHYANFDYDTDPNNPQLVLATDGGIAERSTLFPDYNNWAPRVGLAYKLNGKTVIRTGYGVYYGGVTHIGDRYLHASPPFYFNSPISTDRITPSVILEQGVPAGSTTSNVSNLQTITQVRNNPTPYSQQWNFTIQQELQRNLMFEVGYAGTKGTRLTQRYDGNAPLPGPGNINNRRPYTQIDVPGLGIVTPLSDNFRREFSANSSFHSLQGKLEKRLSAGLSFLATYQFSKTISDARGGADAGGTAPVGVQNPYDLRAEKSLADEHFPHRFVSSVNYDLPFGRGRAMMANAHPAVNAVFGGWAVGGIVTLVSGRRVNLGVQGNPANTGGRNPNRPNVVPGQEIALDESVRTLERWFNTDAFVKNAPFTFGNAARNLVTGPGTTNFDLAAFKAFNPTEAMRIQFRAELFNAFNTPNFGAPGSSVGTGQLGVISGAAPGRIIQFGLKLNF
jgi:outer membrane receptor protein involved in Fe transport